MSALSSQQLKAKLYHPDATERLVVTPLLEPERQIAKASIDVRLGSDFIVPRRTRMSGLLTAGFDSDMPEAIAPEAIAAEVDQMVDRTYVPIGSVFVLHPGQFVLTATLEYVSLPRTLMAYVIGRSSWGRVGLDIATATMVAPGFKGAITFEMVNLGTVPIGLYPGTRIAQLVLHTLSEPEAEQASYGGPDSKYVLPVGPQFSKLQDDTDWALLRRYRERLP